MRKTKIVQKIGLVPVYLRPSAIQGCYALHSFCAVLQQSKVVPQLDCSLPAMLTEVVFGLAYHASLRLRQILVAAEQTSAAHVERPHVVESGQMYSGLAQQSLGIYDCRVICGRPSDAHATMQGAVGTNLPELRR